MNRDFLKEAIADAKTVKESAIANAKIALEEAFSPKLQAMFAQKLEEMDKEEMEEGYDEVDEAVEIMDEEMSDSVMRRGLEGDDVAEKETEAMRDEDDFDLDEILAELEESEGLEEEEITEAEEEEAEVETEEEVETEVEADDEEEIDLEDMSEEDLKSFIEDVIADMVEAGELEAGDAVEDEEDEEVEVEDMDVEDDETESTEVETEETEDIEEGKEELGEIKAELDEALETIAALKSELNEINLLNAKLLYTNKIFKAKNLNESQKVKVLGAFDKAETVKEVKVIFETLSENLKTTKKTVNEGIIGSASKATLAPKTSKAPIVESNEMVNRFKKLAGII